jgi:hypothetical protein
MVLFSQCLMLIISVVVIIYPILQLYYYFKMEKVEYDE